MYGLIPSEDAVTFHSPSLIREEAPYNVPSKSNTPTFLPILENSIAVSAVTVLFPTPPRVEKKSIL